MWSIHLRIFKEYSLKIRVGQGFDVHPFCENKTLKLGGISVDHPFGLKGHSDGDVLLHAIADAILGAIGLQDIGHHFPPDIEETSGMDSRIILKKVAQELNKGDWSICNIDSTIICEKPKIAPYRDKMSDCIAQCLGIATENVQVKATTTEKLGFTGRGEGIAALATCLVMKD